MSKPKMADADDGIFKPGNKLRHIKTGGFYKVVLLANVEANLRQASFLNSSSRMTFGSGQRRRWKTVDLN